MKKKILITIILSTCLLSACGKKEVVEEPPYSVNGLSIVTIPTDVTSEVLPDIIESSESIEEVIIESTISETESSIVESTLEEPLVNEIENLFSIGGSYETINELGLFSIKNEDDELILICNKDEVKYFVDLKEDIKLKPTIEEANVSIMDMKKEFYIMANVVLTHEKEAKEVMKKYGYDEETNPTLDNLSIEDQEKMMEELNNLLSEEEIKGIEDILTAEMKDKKYYNLISFEAFDINNNPLNITSFEDLKEYSEKLILEEILEYRKLLNLEEEATIEKLEIEDDETTISNLKEGQIYFTDERVEIENDSTKVIKVTTMSLNDDKTEVEIDEDYHTQKTNSSMISFENFGNQGFIIWPFDSRIELFKFEFVENEDEIDYLLKEDSLFEGFRISTIKENEIIIFEGDSTTNLFNDLDKTIEIVGKDNYKQEEFRYSLEPKEIINLWTNDLENVYWTYKE